MDYKRFKQLWDALISDRSANGKPAPVAAIGNGMSARTFEALVAYANGDKRIFEEIRSVLKARTESSKAASA